MGGKIGPRRRTVFESRRVCQYNDMLRSILLFMTLERMKRRPIERQSGLV